MHFIKSHISTFLSALVLLLLTVSMTSAFSSSVSVQAHSEKGYGAQNCGPRKVRVAGKCVCNPEHPQYAKCKDADDKSCPEGKFRIGKSCVSLKKIDKINDAFWVLFDQGFWPNLRF